MRLSLGRLAAALLGPVAMVAWSGLALAAAVAPLERPTILVARAIPNDSGRADIATSVLPIEDGALITGWTRIEGRLPDGFLMRVTPAGDVVWRRTFAGDSTDLLWSVLPDRKGGWVMLGFTASQGAGSLDGWIIGLDDSGATRWEKTYGGPGEDRLTAFQATEYGWIAVGQTSGRGAGAVDAWVLRIDPEGNELSTWTSGGPQIDRAFGIQPLPDGGCLIAGMTGADLARIEGFDSFVTRLGPDGRRLWHRTMPQGPGLQVAHDFRPAPDGTFVVYGYGYVDARKHIDGFALRVHPNGRVVSSSWFGGATYDRANHGVMFADGSSAVVGYTQRPGATDEENWWDLVVYVLDPAGKAVWSGRFGGSGVEFGRGIAGKAEDLWVVGHTTTGGAGSRVLLIRLDVSSLVGRAVGSATPPRAP